MRSSLALMTTTALIIGGFASPSMAGVSFNQGVVSTYYATNEISSYQATGLFVSGDYQLGAFGVQIDATFSRSTSSGVPDNNRFNSQIHIYKSLNAAKIGGFVSYTNYLDGIAIVGVSFGLETIVELGKFTLEGHVRGLKSVQTGPVPFPIIVIDNSISWSAYAAVSYQITPTIEASGGISHFFDDPLTTNSYSIGLKYSIPNSPIALAAFYSFNTGEPSFSPSYFVEMSYAFGPQSGERLF